MPERRRIATIPVWPDKPELIRIGPGPLEKIRIGRIELMRVTASKVEKLGTRKKPRTPRRG